MKRDAAHVDALAAILSDTRESAVPMDAAVARDRFARFFSSFTPEGIRTTAPTTYASNAWFNDTLTTKVGLDAITDYLIESAEACQECTVDIQQVVTDDIDVFVRWTMMIRFRKFRKDTNTWTAGMTHLRFGADGLIIMHQDYWDSAGGLLQYLPVIGGIVRWVRAKF